MASDERPLDEAAGDEALPDSPSVGSAKIRSFGHLSDTSSSAARATAERAATPASSGSQPQRAADTSGRRRMDRNSPERGGATQDRPRRPLPAVCDSA